MDALVSTQWLADHLADGDVVPVDCSVFMPSSGRNAAADYDESHIPGARLLDIDRLSDPDDPSPHMLPPPALFAAAMEEQGIGSDDRIVVYDNSPLRSAARGWFMLRHFGASTVAILDGGLQKWTAEKRPTRSGAEAPRDARFDARADERDVITKAALFDSLPLTLLDARGEPRFTGAEADPRPGVAPGHIPGSRNLPYSALYRDDGTFKDAETIEALFAAAGIDPRQPFVATCGSGVTAASLIFAAHLLGTNGHRLYDGSWSEWGADPQCPKALGPA